MDADTAGALTSRGPLASSLLCHWRLILLHLIYPALPACSIPSLHYFLQVAGALCRSWSRRWRSLGHLTQCSFRGFADWTVCTIATKADVENHFNTHGTGEITEIKLMNGFGFIEYKDALDARDVVPGTCLTHLAHCFCHLIMHTPDLFSSSPK